MRAMTLLAAGTPLVEQERPDPEPREGEVRLRVLACGVCRTDLHVMDGDLPLHRSPVVPGHEVVGVVDAIGPGVDRVQAGQRLGLPWLGRSCGACAYCLDERENLCDAPQFTGYDRDGGFATHVIADARFCLPLDLPGMSVVEAAPLMCAGLIGWRSLKAAGEARTLGLYGFGAAAHLIAQVAAWQGRKVFAFTRPGDIAGQAFALTRGASWSGGSDEPPPQPMDAAILFAPAGELVPQALRHVRKGGRVVCGGIHMSDIPSFPYEWLWNERQIVSVANLTRRDGAEFIALAARIKLAVDTRAYPLAQANQALEDLRRGAIKGAAVLVP